MTINNFFDDKLDAQIWEEKIYPLSDKAISLDEQIEDCQSRLKKFYYQDEDGNYYLLPYVENKPKEPDNLLIGSMAGVAFGGAAILSALMFLFHGVIWVIRRFTEIGWNTFGWAINVLIWSMIVAAVITLIAGIIDVFRWKAYNAHLELHDEYWTSGRKLESKLKGFEGSLRIVNEKLDKLLNERFDALSTAINKSLGLPFPPSGLNGENYFDIKSEFFDLIKYQQEVNAKNNGAEKRKGLRRLMDAKLEFFYKHTLPIGTSEDVYGMFAKQLKNKGKDDMNLRCSIPTSSYIKKTKAEVLSYQDCLDPHDFDQTLDYFNSIYHRSTRQTLFFFLTDTEKKAKQTKDMLKVVKQAGKKYDKLIDKIKKTAYILDYVRTCAYHNVYLGVELVNYERETTAGGSMQKANDTAVTIQHGTNSLEVNSKDLQLDIREKDVKRKLNNVDKDIRTTANFLFSSKEMKEWSSNNLNASLAIVGVSAVFSAAMNFGGYIMDYFRKLSANADAQYKMVEYMNNLFTAYQNSIGEILRSIELINALSNTNKGFTVIYEPLREKILVKGGRFTKKEFGAITFATNKYNEVIESKIRNNGKRR